MDCIMNRVMDCIGNCKGKDTRRALEFINMDINVQSANLATACCMNRYISLKNPLSIPWSRGFLLLKCSFLIPSLSNIDYRFHSLMTVLEKKELKSVKTGNFVNEMLNDLLLCSNRSEIVTI